VFATDLYCASEGWQESANATMLYEPGRHWPGPWNQRRLVVQHMNALALHYEDASFDGIFSSSSLEHFGTHEDVRRSMAEMFRVLKPGGLLSLSTEFRIEGPPPGMPGVLMFDRRDIESVIIGDLAWDLVSPLDLDVSPATRRTEALFSDALKDLGEHTRKNSHIVFHRLDWSRYPHVVLREKNLVWTSVHIALRKRAPS
jgi:SAM-dependent methyltransferase